MMSLLALAMSNIPSMISILSNAPYVGPIISFVPIPTLSEASLFHPIHPSYSHTPALPSAYGMPWPSLFVDDPSSMQMFSTILSQLPMPPVVGHVTMRQSHGSSVGSASPMHQGDHDTTTQPGSSNLHVTESQRDLSSGATSRGG
ncbi:hypothetical protein Sjap_019897 [Stephania japonica]|uniref:Uncharacterized protein n=1 Tax=Stephania japonica TaxID=461633 RepID=A0AAP0HV58_9MAGN